MAQTYTLPDLNDATSIVMAALRDNDESLRSCFSGTTAPSSPAVVDGQLWWDTSANPYSLGRTAVLKVYDSTLAAWLLVGRNAAVHLTSGITGDGGGNNEFTPDVNWSFILVDDRATPIDILLPALTTVPTGWELTILFTDGTGSPTGAVDVKPNGSDKIRDTDTNAALNGAGVNDHSYLHLLAGSGAKWYVLDFNDVTFT